MPTPQTGTGAGFDSPLPPGGANVPQTSSGSRVPTSGSGSATELRAQRDNVQAQLDKLQTTIAARQQADPESGPTNSENTLIAQYNASISKLTEQITQAETKPAATPIAGGNPADKYIIQTRPDGTVVTTPNPNWDGKSDKPTTVTVGNKVLNVATDGTVTVAYDNTDAENLAQRQTAAAEANAKTAQLAQQTNDYATRAKVELDQRVANGEDAASVRAEQAQQLAQLHEQWSQANGDALTQQAALRDYNTERHATAQEGLTQQQIENTRAYQAQQDATARRGQDLSAQQAQTATRASLANARLSAGQGYMSNTLDMLSRMNAAAPPGSSAVGDMLVPLMNLGQQFFSQLGGLPSTGDVLGAAGAPPAVAAAASPTDTGVVTTPGPQNVTPAQPTPTAPTDFSQSGIPEGSNRGVGPAALPALQPLLPQVSAAGSGVGNYFAGLANFDAGGVVPGKPGQPQLAVVHGGETVVPPAQPAAAAASPSDPLEAAGLTPAQSFFARLGAGVVQAQQQAGQQAQVAGQGAAALGHPPEAAANPMIPGSAVPGIPPAAAAAQARMRPLSPDGSPYATAQDVASIWQPRLEAIRAGRF